MAHPPQFIGVYSIRPSSRGDAKKKEYFFVWSQEHRGTPSYIVQEIDAAFLPSGKVRRADKSTIDLFFHFEPNILVQPLSQPDFSQNKNMTTQSKRPQFSQSANGKETADFSQRNVTFQERSHFAPQNKTVDFSSLNQNPKDYTLQKLHELEDVTAQMSEKSQASSSQRHDKKEAPTPIKRKSFYLQNLDEDSKRAEKANLSHKEPQRSQKAPEQPQALNFRDISQEDTGVQTLKTFDFSKEAQKPAPKTQSFPFQRAGKSASSDVQSFDFAKNSATPPASKAQSFSFQRAGKSASNDVQSFDFAKNSATPPASKIQSFPFQRAGKSASNDVQGFDFAKNSATPPASKAQSFSFQRAGKSASNDVQSFDFAKNSAASPAPKNQAFNFQNPDPNSQNEAIKGFDFTKNEVIQSSPKAFNFRSIDHEGQDDVFNLQQPKAQPGAFPFSSKPSSHLPSSLDFQDLDHALSQEKIEIPKDLSVSPDEVAIPAENDHPSENLLAKAQEKILRASFNDAFKKLRVPEERTRALKTIKKIANQEKGIVPEHKHAFRDFSVSLRKEKLPEVALLFAARSVALGPNDDHAHFNLARILAILERYDDAIDALNHALALPIEEEERKIYKKMLDFVIEEKNQKE